jgi:hypothetical protein
LHESVSGMLHGNISGLVHQIFQQRRRDHA